MKKVIHKFALAHGARVNLPLLGHLIPRHCDDQYAEPKAWIELDADEQQFEAVVHKIGTGDPIPQGAHVVYLGTTLASHGMFVWHWYAVREQPARRVVVIG